LGTVTTACTHNKMLVIYKKVLVIGHSNQSLVFKFIFTLHHDVCKHKFEDIRVRPQKYKIIFWLPRNYMGHSDLTHRHSLTHTCKPAPG
jgi:hypothetical protein